MGHDIIAHEPGNDEIEFAYVRRGAWNTNAYILYEAFESEWCNGGVSGMGEEVIYTKDQVQKAIDHLKNEFKGCAEELSFAELCLENLNDQNKVAISWC